MSKKITNSESISILESKEKSKSQELRESTKDSIKNTFCENLTEEQIENVEIIGDELWIDVQTIDIDKIKDLKLTKKEIEIIKKNIWFITKSNQRYTIKVDDIREIKNLTEKDIEKSFKVLNELWFGDMPFLLNSEIIFWIFPKLTDEQILLLKEYWIKKNMEILIFFSFINNANRETIRNFIKRKNEYLEKNRTLSKEKFEELFRWNGKYWKAEIRQKSLWLCYAYTWFEILKKTNWFDEIIQTNLRETKNWREVRLPFCDANWIWIKVNKEEIDKEFSISDKNWKNRTFCINSKSEFLWFKILEIAFIKKDIINAVLQTKNYYNKIPNKYKKIYTDFNKSWDFTLNWELITKITEGWDTKIMLSHILKDCIIISFFTTDINDKVKDLVFDQFSKWLLKVEVSPKRKHRINDFKIIKQPHENQELLLLKERILKFFERWRCVQPNYNNDKIFSHHSYSIEKCYITSKWQKRVRIVNPRNTWEKIDISLEDCKDLFKRQVMWLDIDKMFR